MSIAELAVHRQNWLMQVHPKRQTAWLQSSHNIYDIYDIYDIYVHFHAVPAKCLIFFQ